MNTFIKLILISFAMMACAPSVSNKPAAILLFNGKGTSVNDVAAIENILKNKHLSYSTANSQQLNAMGESKLMAYRLIIVPGGNFIDIGTNLTTNTAAAIKKAVQSGVNYLGICAGAFLAGDGGTYYNSVNLTAGVRFNFYSAEKQGIRKAAVAITSVDTTIEHYWEDGPQLTGWGVTLGKYPDGTAAIVQGTSGKGFVILSGVHPEAPENWRHGMIFTTPSSVANAYAAKLIEAALNGTPLAHY